MSSDKLKSYKKKRDFKKTKEPKKSSYAEKTKKPIFVIQKHAASSLHYDFRIQSGNTLKSWAVPKGPSLNPKEKRLAVQTEDHPIDYADFEGSIPEDEYGGGTVLIWDRGTYKNKKDESIEKSHKNGQIEIELYGKKIKGGYALIKTGKNWLLIKTKDEKSDARKKPVKTKPKSVKSKKTLKEIKNEEKK